MCTGARKKTATSHFGLLPILILNKAVNRVEQDNIKSEGNNMSQELPPCVADPLAAVAELFNSAASGSSEDGSDGDWGVKAQFVAALAQPGVLEAVSEWLRSYSQKINQSVG
jgi:hypothetical protein